jgi:hypothetical protein
LVSGVIRGPAAFLYHRIAHLLLLILAVLAWIAVFIDFTEHLSGIWACTYRRDGTTMMCGPGKSLDGSPYKKTTIAADVLSGLIA